jgi:hypothetical protein
MRARLWENKERRERGEGGKKRREGRMGGKEKGREGM